MKDISKLLSQKGLWLGVAIGAGLALLATQVLKLGAAPAVVTTPVSPGTDTTPPGPPQG